MLPFALGNGKSDFKAVAFLFLLIYAVDEGLQVGKRLFSHVCYSPLSMNAPILSRVRHGKQR